MSEIVIYEDGKIELKVGFENETVWLSQKQIVALFEKDQSVISRHINNIIKD
ncbi:virulence protein, partial [Fangia hongkongensis]|nr:virulence protein [Fangia hongkongensis]